MGVKACERDGCREILCDVLVLNAHYVCGSCLHELDELRKAWPPEMTETEIFDHICAFLASYKGGGPLSTVRTGDELESVYRRMTGRKD